MASEISGLPNLHGYLKLGNLVVRMQVPLRSPRDPEAAGFRAAPVLHDAIPPTRRRRRPSRAPTRHSHLVHRSLDHGRAAPEPEIGVAMLTISKPLSAGHAAGITPKSSQRPRRTTTRRATEIHGEWHGQLADQMGTRPATCDEEHFRPTRGGPASDDRRDARAPSDAARVRARGRRDRCTTRSTAPAGTPRSRRPRASHSRPWLAATTASVRRIVRASRPPSTSSSIRSGAHWPQSSGRDHRPVGRRPVRA